MEPLFRQKIYIENIKTRYRANFLGKVENTYLLIVYVHTTSTTFFFRQPAVFIVLKQGLIMLVHLDTLKKKYSHFFQYIFQNIFK